jgi:hypothetical protein
MLIRYWRPRFVATIGQSAGYGVIEHVTWIDSPGDHAEKNNCGREGSVSVALTMDSLQFL